MSSFSHGINQGQWSDKAIAREFPALMGLYVLAYLMGVRFHKQGLLKVESTAWYNKKTRYILRHIKSCVYGDMEG